MFTFFKGKHLHVIVLPCIEYNLSSWFRIAVNCYAVAVSREITNGRHICIFFTFEVWTGVKLTSPVKLSKVEYKAITFNKSRVSTHCKWNNSLMKFLGYINYLNKTFYFIKIVIQVFKAMWKCFINFLHISNHSNTIIGI